MLDPEFAGEVGFVLRFFMFKPSNVQGWQLCDSFPRAGEKMPRISLFGRVDVRVNPISAGEISILVGFFDMFSDPITGEHPISGGSNLWDGIFNIISLDVASPTMCRSWKTTAFHIFFHASLVGGDCQVRHRGLSFHLPGRRETGKYGPNHSVMAQNTSYMYPLVN